MTPKRKPLAVVVKGWPRLSETFIAQELVALEARGFEIEIWSLRLPTDKKRHPLHDQLKADIHYLPEYLHQEMGRVFNGWLTARRLPAYHTALRAFLSDFRRDVSFNRLRRFGQACVLARDLSEDTGGLYAHFMHTPSSVARYCAMMRGLPWGFSAHAKDIWTSPEWEKVGKMNSSNGGAEFGATCTAFGARHLRELAEDPGKIDLVYHGLDLTRFPTPPDRQYHKINSALRLLSVGRLVEKKGFDQLIKSLALLPASLCWTWEHIGGGDLKQNLQEQAQAAGIDGRITWRGACNQPEVINAMRQADIFVLPSRIAKDGDRDGLPNVLMEAASQKIPIISTPISAIPEFIDTGESGILVSDDPQELAKAIERLANSPELQRQFAEAAYLRLTQDFGMNAGLDILCQRLSRIVGQGDV